MSKKALVAGVVVVLLAAGGIGFFTYAKRQPRYALSQLVMACQHRDVITFRRYVNLDAVVSSAVESLKGTTSKDAPPADNSIGQLAAAIQEGVMRLVVPRLSKQLASGVQEAVASGQLDYLRLCGTPFWGGSDDTCNVTLNTVDKQGDAATAIVTVADTTGRHPVHLTLGLRAQSGSWQVVSLGNLQALLAGAPSLLREGKMPPAAGRE